MTSSPQKSARAIAFVAALSALSFLPSCRSEESRADAPDPVVAEAAGLEIPREWYEQTYFDFLVSTGQNDTRDNRTLHLESLIDAALLAGEARRRGLDEDSLFRVFEERERKKFLGGRFFDRSVTDRIPPLSDEENREAFERWKTEVLVRHLFYYRLDSAEAAYRRLQEGRDFLEEAQVNYGLTEFDSSAGYLGQVRYFMVDDAFAEAAYALKPGEYSKPVKTRFGYHIIRVENVIRNPLLTEEEYQTRKQGIGERAALRKRRLAGDEFVRQFMTSLNVRVEEASIRALAVVLEEVEHRVEPDPVTILTPEASEPGPVDVLRDLDYDAPLLRYTYRGAERAFTVGEYLAWLPDLSFAEARVTPARSVGRALRNEVLAMEGRRLGLDDASLQAAVDREVALYLANQLRSELRADTTSRADSDLLRSAFERVGLSRRREIRADFWWVPAASRQEALEARARIARDGTAAAGMQGYQSFTDLDLNDIPPERRYYVRQAPIGSVTALGLSSGEWIVLLVSRRTVTRPTFEEMRSDLESRVGPYVAEYRLIRDLRASEEIRVDSVVFESMVDFD